MYSKISCSMVIPCLWVPIAICSVNATHVIYTGSTQLCPYDGATLVFSGTTLTCPPAELVCSRNTSITLFDSTSNIPPSCKHSMIVWS